MSRNITKIGMFYDGNYFLHVSNYYNYEHPKRKRISLAGLHEFVRRTVAEFEETESALCQIVDSHYFRGRLTAFEASQRGDTLYWDRVFDDVLMSEGITTHYLPLRSQGSSRLEKGIDVWLALDAYELATYKKYDVVALLAGDSDYVPLVRKLNTLGCRVLVLSWDFEYTAENGRRMVTRTSQELLEESSYPLPMHEIIEARLKRDDTVINNLFVVAESKRNRGIEEPLDEIYQEYDYDPTTPKESIIMSLKSGYGFIKYPPNNLFFHYSSLINSDFNELHEGDEIQFYVGNNDDGQPIAINVLPHFAIGRPPKVAEEGTEGAEGATTEAAASDKPTPIASAKPGKSVLLEGTDENIAASFDEDDRL